MCDTVFVCHRVRDGGEEEGGSEDAAQALTLSVLKTGARDRVGLGWVGGSQCHCRVSRRLYLLLHHTLPLSSLLHPFVSLALELRLPPAASAGAVRAARITPSSSPQLRQWKAFEEESQTTSHMAKYFTSPSRSCRSVYSEEQLYQLIGEKNSMKRLLTEVPGSVGLPQPHWLLPFPFAG